MVVFDAFSKWLEIIPMRNITATATIEGHCELFPRFGILMHLVSDNGPHVTSEFAQFTRFNGIGHTVTALYLIQIFKLAFKAGQGLPLAKNRKRSAPIPEYYKRHRESTPRPS